MNLKIVTFNVKIDSPEGFSRRLTYISQKIREVMPDIICFQEMNHRMLILAVQALPEYSIVGGGREYNRLGEGTMIAFNKSRFILGNCRTKWLSPTPDLPGSRYTEDQSGCPRVYTTVTLTEVEEGTTFRIYNTHLDHRGKIARLQGERLLMADIRCDLAELTVPLMLTGDFNADPESAEIREICESGIIRDVTDEYTLTFNNYGKPYHEWDASKIDYIFVSNDVKCNKTELWDETPDGEYMSDHFAIYAELEI